MDQNEDEGRAGGENPGKQDDEVPLVFLRVLVLWHYFFELLESVLGSFVVILW